MKQKRIVEAFRSGDRDTFFKIWDECIGDDNQGVDQAVGKVEFLASIYFAVFALLPNTSPEHAKVSPQPPRHHCEDLTI